MVDASGTYFAADLFPDGNFYGTSAAVPNAAAVAALLRADFPTLSVAQITTTLESGATALGGAVPKGVFGYGRVDALGALATIPTPTITALTNQSSTGSASTTAQPFNVTGTGTVHFVRPAAAIRPWCRTRSSVPARRVLTVSGRLRQHDARTCTLVVTPVTGQAGTAVLTVSALDGANRAATTQVTLTETDPAPGSAGSGGGTAPTGGHSGGGGMQGWASPLASASSWSGRSGRGRDATQK